MLASWSTKRTYFGKPGPGRSCATFARRCGLGCRNLFSDASKKRLGGIRFFEASLTGESASACRPGERTALEELPNQFAGVHILDQRAEVELRSGFDTPRPSVASFGESVQDDRRSLRS